MGMSDNRLCRGFVKCLMRAHSCSVEMSESIACPYCGAGFEIVIDTSAGDHFLVTDCEVCCRPFNLRVQCEPGEILSLSVES